MALLKVNQSQKKALAIATIFAIIVGVFFLKHYLMLIILSAIIAYLFNPVFSWFLKKGRGVGQAALLTFLVSVFAVVVPLIFIITLTVLQLASLADKIGTESYSVNFTDLLNQFVDFVNNTLANLGISKTISAESVTATLSDAIKQFGEALAENVLSSISGIFALITTSIIYIYVFMSMLRNQEAIISSLKRINPLGDEVSDLYLQKIGAMTKATVRGQFTIALCQGLESAIVLSLVGLESWFAFFFILLSFLSLIPLGAGIVTIPLGILMILTGNVWQGVVVIANHLLIVTNIDNVLRPKLVPASAKLDSALMILAVFSGLAFFGFIGIVIGPVLMIIIQTTIQMFIEVFHQKESLDRTKDGKKRSLYKRLKNRFNTT